jgi:hypothetical protein
MLGLDIDPVKFGKYLWPHVTFYGKQKDILYSIQDNKETIVTAGNMLGGCPLLG